MTSTISTLVIDQPGVYDGMSDETYHGDPVPGGSLSSSGARKLLPPSCPARFRWEQDHGRPPKREFDYGHAAHLEVLGVGAEIEVVPGDRWDTKAAKEKVAEVRARGATPLKQADYDQVQAMAAALRQHPIAGALLRPGGGKPEQSAFWADQKLGVWRRARFDWLPNPGAGRLIVPDYKTCRSAAPDHLQRAINEYGYHQQASWYLDAVAALGLGADPQFVFVCQEKAAPYLVTVAQPDPTALRIGAHLNRMALMTYRECVTSGRWPGYSDDVELIQLPAWVEKQYDKEIF